ncbi:MAG: hypothetical protein PHS14_20785, partial [Elusimicrobia bacterium]|nr:hypothetical protein [Elusimicrobiota bacterium]
LSGDFNKIALDDGMAEFEVPTFGDVGIRRVSGLGDVVFSGAGYWNRDAARSDEILAAELGVADVPVAIGPNTLLDGAVAYIFRCLESSYAPTADINAPAPFTVAGKGSAGERLIRSTVMRNAVHTINTNGVVRQLGTVSATQRLYASLHVIAASGAAPTCDVTIRSDDAVGFPSSTLQLTFAQKTTTGQSEMKSVAGPITDDYYRVGITLGGGTPSFTIIVAVGIR